MKRSGPPKRKTPLKATRGLQNRSRLQHPTNIDSAWESAREAALRRDLYSCQARAIGIAGRCLGKAHVHHIKRRSQGGTHALENLLTLCGGHHAWVHEHVAEAKALGALA